MLGFIGHTDPLPLGIRSDVPTDATVEVPIDHVAPHIRLTITSTGEVIASGWAAMIVSERELRVGATGQAGPRRRRADIDSGQLDDTIDLSTSIWVELAVREDTSLTIPMMRP